MQKQVWLKYTLPILGNIEIPLYGETCDIYSFLKQQNQIDRLKNLNQLGIISDVIQTAHHSKFEYLIFMLFLIERMKSLKGTYPLGRIIDGQVTGKELLKIWALLLSVGHMPGTFPVEKAVLKYLRQEQQARREFMRYIWPRETRDYINKLLEKQSIYSFYHALAFFLLRRSSRAPESIRSQELLSLYCYNYGKPSLRGLKELFKKIRSFAHLALDSYYTGSPNIFAATHVNKIPTLITTPHFDRFNNALKTYLVNEIYRSPQSIIAEVALYNAFHIRLKKVGKPVDFIYRFLKDIRGDAEVFKIYSDYREKMKLDKFDFYEPLQITTNRGNIFAQEREIYLILFKFFQKKNKFNILLFNVDKSPDTDSSVISIFLNKKHKFKRVGLIPNLLRELLAEIRKNESLKYNNTYKIIRKLTKSQPQSRPQLLAYFKRDINENNIRNLFNTLFRLLFAERKVETIRFISRKIDFLPDAFVDTSPYIMGNLIESLQINEHEILELNRLINDVIIKRATKGRPKLVVLISNIELHRSPKSIRGYVIGEIDGAVLSIEGTKLFLYLLEAKKRTRAYSEGRKQLLKIKKFLKETYKKKGMIQIRRLGKQGKSHYLRIKIS